MSSDRGKLGGYLREVIDWRWDDFCRAEEDSGYTGIQAAVFSLVRICSDGKLGGIKLAIDRVDGKLETPVKIEYPKIWMLYPYAENVALPSAGEAAALALPDPDDLPETPPEAEEENTQTAATMSLREMVSKMADQPKELIPLILGMKKKVEMQLEANQKVDDGDMVDEKVPLVKSVIAANLLHLAIQRNNFDAITEVFDQIDGKLVETIRILADDVFLTQFALQAPYGAVKNKDGVYMIEATEIAEQWKQKLKRD